MNKETLMSHMDAYIQQDPSILGELFKLVSDNWEKMVVAQNRKRESVHLHALSQLLDNVWMLRIWKKKNPTLFTNEECCTLIDALDAVYPHGIGNNNCSVELLSHMAKSCRALGWKPHDNFVKGIRAKQYFLTKLYENHKEEAA